MYNADKFDIMSLDEKHQYFIESCGKLRRNGLYRYWKELAQLLDVSPNSISGAKNMNPDYLTSSLLAKIDDLLLCSEDPSISISHSPHTNVATGQSIIKVGSKDVDDQTEASDELVPVIPRRLYKEADVKVVDYIDENEDSIQWSPEVKQFPKTTCFYTVDTMAMYPHFHQGDILALKAIDRNAPIVNGEVYAIDTKELGILVRFIYDRGEEVELRSSDSTTRFESFRISRNDIFTFFRVVGLMRTNI